LRAAVAKLEESVLAALARGETVGAPAIELLLRRYRHGGRDDLAEIAGAALAAALEDEAASRPVRELADELALFLDACQLSDDDRIAPAIAARLASLRPAWSSPRLAERAAALDGALTAASLEPFRHVAADAIDHLEQLVGRGYEPGEPLGDLSDQVATAGALLSAYLLSARLPYSMLAEELMQRVRVDSPPRFRDACDAARVLCRLALLHDDPDYTRAAVVAPGARYRDDAARLLDRAEADALALGAGGAIYGLAALELESPNPGP
jgi:hypothetical protein